MKNHGFGGLGGSKGGLGEGLGAILAPIAEKVTKNVEKVTWSTPPLGTHLRAKMAKKSKLGSFLVFFLRFVSGVHFFFDFR